MYLFLYDTLMNSKDIAKIIDNKMILSVRPAFVKGVCLVDSERQKSYYSNLKLKSRFPIMIDKSELYHRVRNPLLVYGACVELEDDLTAFKLFDGYYSCSMFSLGENKDADMFHRRQTDISIIEFNTLEDFLNCKFEVKEVVSGYAYYGNLKHDMLKYKFSKGQTNIKTIGVVWKSFFNTF